MFAHPNVQSIVPRSGTNRSPGNKLIFQLVLIRFKEAEMLIEADLAAQNEKYLTRLGRLNPLPINKGLVL